MGATTEKHPGLGGLVGLLYGGLAYAAFIGSFGLYWVAFLADRWVPFTVDRRLGGTLPIWQGILVDLCLILLFGLQHSVMARPAFKRRWTRLVPPALERSTYVLLSSICLILLMAFWQPWPAVVWNVGWEPARVTLWVLFAVGLLVSVAASFQIDHLELFGLRQAWARFRGESYGEPDFVEPWLYRVVRHPIQTGILLMLWSAPTMTAGRLLLAAAMTGYILIGLHYEERNLVASIGQRYREYRGRVPGLIPIRSAWLPRRALLGGILVATVVLGLVAAAFRAGTPNHHANGRGALEYRRLTIDGMERTYAVFPVAHARRRTDTFVVLHGSSGDIERIRRFTGRRFERLAMEHGFRVIYPQGFEGNWNGCRAGTPFSSKRLAIDDVTFLKALFEREAGNGGGRFAFGFSGGGHMAYRMALEAPESLDGITVVGANLPYPANSDCTPARAERYPAVLVINGTDDPINPYHGGPVIMPAALGGHDLGPVLSSDATIRYFAERNGHRGPPNRAEGVERDGDPATGLRKTRWESPGRPAVELITVLGGGHTIPQAGVAFPALAGRHSFDLDAPAVVIENLSKRREGFTGRTASH